MNVHTKHQVIKKDGVPLFVIVPYDEFIEGIQSSKKSAAKTYLPQAVVEKAAIDGKSLLRAWREYKRMSQKDVAEKMGITQAAYCQHEKAPERMRAATIKKVADALDVSVDQLQL